MPFLSASGVSPYNKIRGGGSALVVPFNFENALKFDGVNDYVNFTQTASLPDYTVSAWFKPTVFNKFFMSNDNSFSNVWMRFSTLIAFRDVTGAKIGNFYFPALSLNDWHHFILVGTGGSAKLFVDGVESTSGAQALGNMQFSNLGRSASSANTHFNGVIDETAIWTSALTDTQAINQYNSGAGNFANADVEPLIWYKLNETGSTTTALNSGSGGSTYNGILNNFTLPGAWVSHTPYDVDAEAFNTAAAITGTTQKSAITNLVLDLKGNGSTTNSTDVWSKLYAFYPMCPIDASTFTLTACKWNLVNPLDTDAAFRMTWVNSPAVSYEGVKGDGSSSYGDTHFVESAHMTAGNNGMTRDNFDSPGGNSQVFAGADYPSLAFRRNSVSYSAGIGLLHSAAPAICTISRLNSSGFTIYKDGISVATSSTNSSAQANESMFICAASDNSGNPIIPLAVGNKTFSIHDGLTANEALDLKDALTNYDTALGR